MAKSEEEKDEERFWNFVLYKFYGTDEEMEEFFSNPWLWVLVGVVIAIFIAIGIFSS